VIIITANEKQAASFMSKFYPGSYESAPNDCIASLGAFPQVSASVLLALG
jgi:hypothetical protein